MNFSATVHDIRTVNSYTYLKTDAGFPHLGSCLISERPDGKTAVTCLAALPYQAPRGSRLTKGKEAKPKSLQRLEQASLCRTLKDSVTGDNREGEDIGTEHGY